MKTKIIDALKTEYAKNGLSEKAFGGVAEFLINSKTVNSEEDIITTIKGDVVKNLIKSIQGETDAMRSLKAKAERDLVDYKNAHPDVVKEEEEKTPPIDMSATIAAAVAEALKPLQEEISSIKGANSLKDATNGAHVLFFGNEYVKKFSDEGNDAWERACELNEATGGKMTAEELKEKALSYFNKSVSRKGVDTTKPFEPEVNLPDEGTTDWAGERARKVSQGLVKSEK